MIYKFLLDVVRNCSPEIALDEFKALFLEHRSHPGNLSAFSDLVLLLKHNEKDEFLGTLKRCCYILVNNWETQRKTHCIPALVSSFTDVNWNAPIASKPRQRLQAWLQEFVTSQDYEDLKLFTAQHLRPQGENPTEADAPEPHWSTRYTSYLLVPQFMNAENSPEQRAVAQKRSQELKDKFKFDLAMYTARSQSGIPDRKTDLQNPTGLGDDVLRLIKTIVARQGRYSYSHFANIFLKQIQGLSYGEFKGALCNYLSYSTDSAVQQNSVSKQLLRRIQNLYPDYSDDGLDEALLLRTCNRVIDFLTIERNDTPSDFFVFILTQGHALTLVVLLLKIVLVCPNTRTHLDHQVAKLIRYYMQYPVDDCDWVVHFFEVFNIAFAIHGDRNVEYNLIRIRSGKTADYDSADQDLMENYRIFSQYKDGASPKLIPFEKPSPRQSMTS
jgi:hypothetical protein